MKQKYVMLAYVAYFFHTYGMRKRRTIVTILTLIGFAITLLAATPPVLENVESTNTPVVINRKAGSAEQALATLSVKGRAPKTNYARTQFGNGWATTNGCSTRQIVLYRDLKHVVLDGACVIVSGTLNDPYTGTTITFTKDKSSEVQIDHVVALSDAWQSGAQQLAKEERVQLANDPLELLAVEGDANQQKSDGNAASWLPSNKSFRCEYIARQIAVKQKYHLWVTEPEKQVMLNILASCPDQSLPTE